MFRFDQSGPQLYHMDPSGTYLKFDAKAIGSGSEGAQQSLQVVGVYVVLPLQHAKEKNT